MRTSTDQILLFSRASLFDALRGQSEAIRKRVQAIAESVMRARPDAELVEELAADLRIIPLELFRDRATMTKEEVEIDVSGDPMRDIFPNGRPILIPGIKVIVSVPYRGDKELWHFRPSTFQQSGPRGTIHVASSGLEGTLDLAFKQPADDPPEQIKTALNSRLSDIEFFLNSQRNDLKGYDEQMRREIASAVAERRSRLTKHDSLSSLLGIPEARIGSGPSPIAVGKDIGSRPAQMPSNPYQSARWDAFVSHASEDKESFVRPLVNALQDAGLKVWFDEHTLKVGDGLRRSIDRGLAQSRFGVVIVSKQSVFLERVATTRIRRSGRA